MNSLNWHDTRQSVFCAGPRAQWDGKVGKNQLSPHGSSCQYSSSAQQWLHPVSSHHRCPLTLLWSILLLSYSTAPEGRMGAAQREQMGMGEREGGREAGRNFFPRGSLHCTSRYSFEMMGSEIFCAALLTIHNWGFFSDFPFIFLCCIAEY